MTTGQLLTVLVTVLTGVAMVAAPFLAASRRPLEPAASRPGDLMTTLELTETTTHHPAGSVTRTRRVLLRSPAGVPLPDGDREAPFRLLDPAFFDPRTTAPVERAVRLLR